MKLLLICVPYDQGRSGISVYIDNCVAHLAKAGHDLTLAVEDDDREHFGQYRQIVLPKFCRRAVWSMLYCLYILPFKIDKKAYDRVIYLAGNRRLGAFRRGETWAVVHDLSQYHVKTKYDVFRMFYIKWILPHYLRKTVDCAVAISRSTARDLVEYWRVPSGRIAVNYNGIDREHLPIGSNDGKDKVILYLSRLEHPGKNHIRLIDAFERLPEKVRSGYQLVFAGANWSGAEKVHERAENSPCHAQIKLTGYLDNQAKNEYLKHAKLCVFPSLFEGFGLPLVEAMACGLPVIASNNSSLGEIAGAEGITFDPYDPQSIADKMLAVLSNPELAQKLREYGLKRAQLFDWDKNVAVLTGVLPTTATVLGCRFTTMSFAQMLTDLDQLVKASDSKMSFGAFVNADCFNQAYENADYAAVLAQADRVYPDGVGAAWAAKWAHTPVHGNLNGTDLLPKLCEKGYKLFLLGGAEGVAERSGLNLRAEFAQAKIVGTHPGFLADEAAEKAVVDQINLAKPEILLVGMGVPKQEFWIVKHREHLHCPLALGVGGLFDFASGRIPRAPLWLRRIKLEWVYRLYQEPRRLFKRYIIGNPKFLFRVWFKSRKFAAGQRSF